MAYDSEKAYSWNPDEIFTMSGREFGLVLNTLRSVLATEKAQEILLVAKANEVLEKIMKENVESGKIVELDKSDKTMKKLP